MNWDADTLNAMKGLPSIQVTTSQSMVAACLWDYGEDELAERAIGMNDDDLSAIERISAVYRDPNYPLPVTGYKITNGHVLALAAVAYFEGQLRPLSQNRRRPSKFRPKHLTPLPPEPGRGIVG